MKYRLMDTLAYHICNFPLKLQVFKERVSRSADKAPYPLCEEFCGLSYIKISEMKDEPLCDTFVT